MRNHRRRSLLRELVHLALSEVWTAQITALNKTGLKLKQHTQRPVQDVDLRLPPHVEHPEQVVLVGDVFGIDFSIPKNLSQSLWHGLAVARQSYG